jgi:hypothetical protein
VRGARYDAVRGMPYDAVRGMPYDAAETVTDEQAYVFGR